MESRILREAMTAYQAVYDPELRNQLEEDQAFKSWVNSLVEEGYDLSEYTWEDMYGIYVSEDLIGDVWANRGKIGSALKGAASGATKAASSINRGIGSAVRKAASGTVQTAKDMGTGFRYAGSTGAAAALGANIAKGIMGAGKPPATKPTSTSTTSTPRPTATTPKSSPAPTTSTTTTTAAAPKRTFNPLMQKTFGYQTGYAPDQVKGDIKKMAQLASLKAGFDLFDLVKGYLLDEGYADTEESAIKIMANMSEEWRQSIFEVLDTPEKANEYAKKNVKSMIGAFAKGVVNKDMDQMKTIKKRTEGAKMAKRKAERKASEEN